MSKPEPESDDVVLFACPEPNSDAMVTALGNMIEQMLQQIPFTFSCGDVMGAALYVVIDAGLMNAPTPEKLRQDIIDGLDRIMADRVSSKGKLN